MWSADVAALSVDGWQLNEDAVVTRSQTEYLLVLAFL